MAHRDGWIRWINAIGTKMLNHLLDELFPTWMSPSRFDLFTEILVISGSEANIRKIAPSGRVVADLDLGIERLWFSISNRFDEVRLMAASTIAFKLFDEFAIFVIGSRGASLTFQSAGLAVDDIAAPGP